MLKILHTHSISYLKISARTALHAIPIRHVSKSAMKKLFSYPANDKYSDAYVLFDKMLKHKLGPWNAMIRDSCMNADYVKALSLSSEMLQLGLRPDHNSLPALLKSCAALSTIELGRGLHASVLKEGYDSCVDVQKALINMYAKCRALHDSYRLFCGMGQQDPVLWNILMTGYTRLQLYEEVLELFFRMHVCEEQPKPNAITVAIVLPICARLKALRIGRSIHAYGIKSGLILQTLVGNALLSMYAKCGSILEDAHGMFHQIPSHDVVSWNAMIAGYAENGLFVEAFGSFRQMLEGDWPNYATIATILPICALLEGVHFGKEIHCYVLRSALDADVSVCNALITFYSRIGNMEEAEYIFRKLHFRDLVSWNTVIAGYAVNGWLSKALEMFHELLLTGMKPDSVTFISVLPVCAQLCDVSEGRKIHEFVLGCPEICEDMAVKNALISFYAKCGELEEASRTFASMRKRDLISWNSMIAAYTDGGLEVKTVELLHRMQDQGIRPDSVTILSLLRESIAFNVKVIKEVHGYSIRVGLAHEVAVVNAILDMYAKCGSIDYAFKAFKSLSGKNLVTNNAMISGCVRHGFKEDAEMIFYQMQERDLTTWNLMVQACAQNDCPEQALNLFCELQHHGMQPDVVSIMSVLPVCAHLVSAHLLRQCHAYSIRACFDDVCLEGALLDVYSKCGSIIDAHKLFQMSPQKDLVMFTAMIGGYAMHGMGKEAVEVYNQMLEYNIKADHIVMTAILSACSHAGLVEEGWKHFNSIGEIHGIKPTMEHYSCMVDLLARAGHLKEAYAFVNSMPVEANANVWGTLLGACKTHREVELGRVVASRLFDAEAENIGNYVVLSNIYAADGRWDGVQEVRRLMKMKELRKPAGCSWIEVERRMHVFVAADSSHPQRDVIYGMLKTLNQQIKEPLGRGRPQW
ncbi:hypothetical protein AAC387_Pa07g1322 [Persea americana]